MKVLAIIPARYASTRLPGKPLSDIGGISMIMRVYNQAKKCRSISRVIVATDDQRILDHVLQANGEALLTSTHHQSGTDRCAEILKKLTEEFDIILNIQGDEPFIQPEQLEELIACFKDKTCEIATLAKKIIQADHLNDENKVKVVRDVNNDALYFSRYPIPFSRNSDSGKRIENHHFLMHIGLYGFKKNCLNQITRLQPGKLEIQESLEQLRWLENGYKIKVADSQYESMGIDTAEDLEQARKKVGK